MVTSGGSEGESFLVSPQLVLVISNSWLFVTCRCITQVSACVNTWQSFCVSPCLYLLSGFLTGVIGFGAHSNPVWSHLNFITSLISYFQVRSLSQALGTRTSAYLFTLPTQTNVISVLSLLWLKVIRVGLKILLFCQAFSFFMQETLS